MKRFIGLLCVGLLASFVGFTGIPQSAQAVQATVGSPALDIQSVQVPYLEDLDLLVFEQQLSDVVGSTLPQAAGQMDGAPVLGYVFPMLGVYEVYSVASGELSLPYTVKSR